jgi:hypothetical protein
MNEQNFLNHHFILCDLKALEFVIFRLNDNFVFDMNVYAQCNSNNYFIFNQEKLNVFVEKEKKVSTEPIGQPIRSILVAF